MPAPATRMSIEPFTYDDVTILVRFWPYLQGRKHVRWLDDDEAIRSGTIRYLTPGPDELDSYLRPGQDVREAFVRITTDSGWEITRPLMAFARLFSTGCAEQTS